MTTTTATRKHGAELTFTERMWQPGDRGLPGWTGQLLNPEATDRVTGQPARNVIARITYAPTGLVGYDARYLEGYGQPAAVLGQLPSGELVYADAPYAVTLQGNSPSGRRHAQYATLEAAQAALLSWARRRFYVEA